MTDDDNMRRTMFAATVERAINASDKTQSDIASMIGYPNPNIITMIKKGTTRLPLEKVSLLATALGLDPAELIRSWFNAYAPDAVASLNEHLGLGLTREEKSWVNKLRQTFDGKVPTYNSRWDRQLAQIKAATGV